jgi:hypothetical protein
MYLGSNWERFRDWFYDELKHKAKAALERTLEKQRKRVEEERERLIDDMIRRHKIFGY